jgi:hypothetical protein
VSDINKCLAVFDPIDLSEMESVALMNRTDTKFVFRVEHLGELLQLIAPHYRVLEVNGVRASRYETLYYDTCNFSMYHDHHRGRPSRYKVRHRIYVDSSLHFFEIKFKNNKGRTIKDRIKAKEVSRTINGKAEMFLGEKTGFKAAHLFPKLWSNCSRITLVNRKSKERVTLDINLQFKNDDKEKNFPALVIAEVKQEKAAPSPIISLMKSRHVREGSISKYCYGVALLYESVKKNNFKPNLLNLQRVGAHSMPGK